MGRRTKNQPDGYSVVRKKDGEGFKKNLYIQGYYKGVRIYRSTGTGDGAEATRAASKMWIEHIEHIDSGRQEVEAKACATLEGGLRLSTKLCGLEWIEQSNSRPRTVSGLILRNKMYAKEFPNLTDATADKVEAWMAYRLGHEVQRDTVLKDQRILRQILQHAKDTLRIKEVPAWRLPDKRKKGKKAKGGRGKPKPVNEAVANAILAALPVKSRCGIPVRAINTILYETGLRITLLYRVTTPRHWGQGDEWLNITEEISKIGFARRVKLSPKAVAAFGVLHKFFTERPNLEGLLACSHRKGEATKPHVGKHVKAAAIKVMGAEDGARFHTTTWRSSRITHWVLHKKATDPKGFTAKIGRMVGQTNASIMERYLVLGEGDIENFFEDEEAFDAVNGAR